MHPYVTMVQPIRPCFTYIHQPVVDMREEPSLQAKVSSQSIFSERILVEKEQNDWSHILTSDGYAGWAPSNCFTTRAEPYEATSTVSRLRAHVYEIDDIEYGPILTLPFGAALHAVDITDARWAKVSLPNGKQAFIQKGDILPIPALQNKGDLVQLSQRFLELPYTWGGRSSFGYDCSGFVQMIYTHIRIQLPRNSSQQAHDDRFNTLAIENLEPGDLLFFGKSEQQIGHVGMYLSKGSFIHATSREGRPWIRISKLSDDEWSGKQDAYYPFRTARQLIIQ